MIPDSANIVALIGSALRAGSLSVNFYLASMTWEIVWAIALLGLARLLLKRARA